MKSDRAVAMLRLASALVVGLCSTLLFLAAPQGGLLRILAFVGWAVAIGWFLAWRRHLKLRPSSTQWALQLNEEGLAIEKKSSTITVPWAQIEAIDVDEERLTVVLSRTGADPVPIEPCWGGLGLYDLHGLLQAHRQGAITSRHG